MPRCALFAMKKDFPGFILLVPVFNIATIYFEQKVPLSRIFPGLARRQIINDGSKRPLSYVLRASCVFCYRPLSCGLEII